MKAVRSAVLVGAALANAAVLAFLGWQIYETRRLVEAQPLTSADTDFVVCEDAQAYYDPAEMMQRIQALEQKMRGDAIDAGARTMAEEAHETARQAQADASEAYRKALEPCTIHGIC